MRPPFVCATGFWCVCACYHFVIAEFLFLLCTLSVHWAAWTWFPAPSPVVAVFRDVGTNAHAFISTETCFAIPSSEPQPPQPPQPPPQPSQPQGVSAQEWPFTCRLAKDPCRQHVCCTPTWLCSAEEGKRRFRSTLRHELLTVAMALAEELHHSVCRAFPEEEEEVEQYAALRGQTRPAVCRSRCSVWAATQALVDPVPQGAVRRPFCPCPHDPLFVLPLVVCGPAHDDSAVTFLLAQTLLECLKEEEQVKRREEEVWVSVQLLFMTLLVLFAFGKPGVQEFLLLLGDDLVSHSAQLV